MFGILVMFLLYQVDYSLMDRQTNPGVSRKPNMGVLSKKKRQTMKRVFVLAATFGRNQYLTERGCVTFCGMIYERIRMLCLMHNIK